MEDTNKEIFTESIQVQIAAGDVLASALEAAACTIAESMIN
ncbi:DnaA initiator-associating protein DiaA, partial [Pseudoalteromonas sp. S558]